MKITWSEQILPWYVEKGWARIHICVTFTRMWWGEFQQKKTLDVLSLRTPCGGALVSGGALLVDPRQSMILWKVFVVLRNDLFIVDSIKFLKDTFHVPYICCRKHFWTFVCYLTYKWTFICPLSQITPLRWLLTYTSHKHATLSIYMLLETYLDMYMSIQPNHTIDMTVNIHIQQTCCQLTIQHLYSINGGVTFYLYSIFIFIFNWMVVAPLAVHQSSNGLSYKWNKITSLPHCEAKEWVKTIHNVSKAGWHASSG